MSSSHVILILSTAVCGGLGAAARFAIDRAVTQKWRTRVPWALFGINLSGSLALGVLTGLAYGYIPEPLAVMVMTGFLGGYTTFSTASLDAVRLLREGHTKEAMLVGPGMLIGAVALAVAGIVLGSLAAA